jgi:hypothetical protein
MDDISALARKRAVESFDHALASAVTTEHVVDTDDETVHEVRTQHDIDSIIAYNRHLADNMHRPYYGHDAMRRVGTIPLIVAEQWAKEAGVRPFSREFQEVVKKKLMSSEFAYLRVKSY